MSKDKVHPYGNNRSQEFSERFKTASGGAASETNGELLTGGVGESRKRMNKMMGIESPDEEYPQ